MSAFDKIIDIFNSDTAKAFLNGEVKPTFGVDTIIGFDTASIQKVVLAGLVIVVFAVLYNHLLQVNRKVAIGLGVVVICLSAYILTRDETQKETKAEIA